MKRFILYIIGLNLIAVAVVLNIRYSLGVAAFSSVMYSISEIYRISLGTASIICYLLFVLMQCVLSKRITVTFLLEVPLSLAFGVLTDVYDWLVPDMELNLIVRIVLFIMTMFVTSMGVYLCVKTDLVLTPTDGIVKTISEAFALPFSAVKNAFDISLVAISALLCIVNRTEFYGIGIGTVLSAICLGRIIKLYGKLLPLRELEKLPESEEAGESDVGEG